MGRGIIWGHQVSHSGTGLEAVMMQTALGSQGVLFIYLYVYMFIYLFR